MTKFIALVDMDGVVADIEVSLVKYIEENFPDAVRKPDLPMDIWEIELKYEGLERDDLTPFFYRERSFLDIPVIAGAYEGVERLAEVADVWFCSTPKNSLYCGGEKTAWIDKHFPEYVRKLHLTKDKTFVRGNILIDDKPNITGVYTPDWAHIRYGQHAFTWDQIDILCRQIEDGDYSGTR